MTLTSLCRVAFHADPMGLEHDGTNIRAQSSPRRILACGSIAFGGFATLATVMILLIVIPVVSSITDISAFPTTIKEEPVRPGDAAKQFGYCPAQPSVFSAPLRWGSKPDTADHICCKQHRYAEYAGYWLTTSIPRELPTGQTITFYDPSTGLPLFIAPVGRSYAAFFSESVDHGWPSFRDEEVVAENVRSLPGGETVSINGTRAPLPPDRPNPAARCRPCPRPVPSHIMSSLGLAAAACRSQISDTICQTARETDTASTLSASRATLQTPPPRRVHGGSSAKRCQCDP